MNKSEFLEILSGQLAGKLSQNQISAHIQYYNNYIKEELAKGRAEEEIMEELGDPRLIAKTLTGSGGTRTEEGYYEETPISYSSKESSGKEKPYKKSYKLDLTTWYGKAIVILIAALVIIFLITLLSALLPVILVAGLVMFLISAFKRR